MSEGADVIETCKPSCFPKIIDEETQKAIDEVDSNFLRISLFKQKNSALLSDPGDEYLMSHKRRGKCVIFNHRYFDEKSLNERKGTEIDAHALRKCFNEYGFDVKTYDDLTVAELITMLKALSKEDHSDADCFACCIMTHGDQANLWARNDKYPIDLLFTHFTADNCPTLAGKPKLFFVQACRGDKLDPGVILKIGGDETDSARYYTIPTWADFLIAYSTVPGYYSWRNTRDGSWFMQSLAEVMLMHGNDLSFLDIMTKVNRKVAYDYTSSMTNDKKFDKQKQAPSTVHMLTRRLVLRSKKTKNEVRVAASNSVKDTNQVIENINKQMVSTVIVSNSSSTTTAVSTRVMNTAEVQQIQTNAITQQVTKDVKI